MLLTVCRPEADLKVKLRPLVTLVKKLDKLSCKNNEIFIKAYFKLHVAALPTVLALYSIHLKDVVRLDEEINDQNDLLQLVRI